MKKSKILVLFLTIVVLLTCVAPLSASAIEYPDITSKAAILVELTSGKTLFAKNEDEQLPIASVTKVMTVYLAALACKEQKIEDEMVVAGDDIYDDLDDDSSTLYIQPGEKMRFIDLMYCALVASANEACNIIAEHLCGSVDAFVDRMNEKAQELGCTNTHFMNPHGLTQDGHYSSARDISIILQNASKVSYFSRIAQTETYSVPKTNFSEPRKISNTNRLIHDDSEYYSEYCTGGKTGYTSAAGYCLAATAESSGKSLVCVVLGADEVTYEDGYTEIMSFAEVKNLIDWGVDNFTWKSAVSAGDTITSVPIAYGAGKDSVKLASDSSVSFFVPVDTVQSDFTFETKLDIKEGETELTAPVDAGEVIGFTNVYYDGELGGNIQLLASESVKLDKQAYAKSLISNFFKAKIVRIVLIAFIVFFALYIVLIVLNTIKRLKRKQLASEKQKQLSESYQDGSSLNVSSIRSDSLTKDELRHIIHVYGGKKVEGEDDEATNEEAPEPEVPEEPEKEEQLEAPASEPAPVPEKDASIPDEEPSMSDVELFAAENTSLLGKVKGRASAALALKKEKGGELADNRKGFFDRIVPTVVSACQKALLTVFKYIFKAYHSVRRFIKRLIKTIKEKHPSKEIFISLDEMLTPEEIAKLGEDDITDKNGEDEE